MEAAKRAAERERAAGRAEAYAQSGRTMLDRAMMDRAIERATGQKPQRGMTPGPKAQQLELMVSQREEQKEQEAARMAMERMLRDEPNHSGTVGGNHGAVGGGSFDLPEDRSRGLYGSDSIFDPLRTPTKAHDFYAGLDLEKAGKQLDILKEGGNRDAVARQEAAVRKAADIQADNAQALMYGNYDAGKAKQERDALRAAADQAQSSVDEYILGEYMDKREKLDAGYLYGSPEYLAAEEQLKAERAEKEAGAAGAQQKVRQLDDQIFEAEQYATQAGYEAAMRTDPQFDRYAAIGAGMGGVAENTPKKGSWQLDLDAIEQANKREKFMTDTQRAVFQYTLGKHGWDEAEKYLKSLDREINRKAAADTFAATDQWVDSGVPGTIAANLYTVGASLGEGQAYLINAMDSAMGNRIDPYAAHNMVGRVNEEIRGKTAQNIQNGVGGFMGDAAAFLYQTGMSVADFSLVALTLGGGPTSLALMGARSAQSATMDAMDRGASDAQALTAGFWAGAAEVIFEKVSLDNFIKLSEGGGTGTFIANVFRQMGIEASEEFATEIANQISDYLVMGGLSNYQLAVKAYVQQGKSQEEAAKLARWDAAKQVGLAAVGGAVSGGFTGAQGQAIAAFNRHSNEKYIRPAGAPAQQPQNANDPIMQAAQIAAEREMQEEMHASAKVFPSAPSSLEQNAQAFRDAPAQPAQNTNDLIMQAAQKAWEKENPQARAEVVPTVPRAEGQAAVAVNGDGEALGPITVTGVNGVENGHVYFDVQNADGTTGVMSDMDVDFADPETTELLASGVAGKLDARGVDAMLSGYNPAISDAGQYAREFAGIYSRAKAGMDYRQAADGSLAAQAYLTPEARQAAWTAGNAARNATTATQTAKTAKFQKAVLDGLNRVTGGKIRLTDADIGANGYYDPETREIVISSKADKGAYVYVAVHEMVHKLKAENVEAWSGFQTLVEDALLANGVDVDAAIAGAKELYRRQGKTLSTEAALEEVICNSAASILQDEKVLRDLVSKDRTTMQRVADFLREFLDNLTQAIQNLGRSMSELESWKQMQALKNDHESLTAIYEKLVSSLAETNGQERSFADTSGQEQQGVKLSVSESFEAEYDAWAKDKTQKAVIRVGTTSDVLVQLGAKSQKVLMYSDDINHALRHDGMTDEIMKQIPQMMENPIIAMKSSQLGDKNQHEASRVVMYGNVVDANGAPVIAVLELRERLKGGQILDMQLVKNAYGKDNRLDIQIQKSEILYLDTDKKRTNSWLQSVGLQLPSDATSYGSIGSISYPDGYVKMQGVMYADLLKNATNKTNVQGAKFSLKETVEETRNLLAVHNLTEENVLGALKLGGMPMPSIAVIKAESGHTKYGPISFVFDKNSIDPEADSCNKIYGGDAWTPTAPQVEYPVNDDIRRAFERRIDELSGSVADGMFRRGSVLGALGVDDVSDMSVEQLAQRLAGQDAVKAAYLAQKGVKLEPVIRYAEDAVDSLGNDALQTYMDAVGTESLESELEALTAGAKEETAAALKKVRDALYAHFRKKRPFSSENSMRLRADKVGEARASEFVKNAMEYAQNGALGKQVVDRMATQDKLSETAKRADVSVWVQGEINGMLGEAGIYNGKERFTPSGNSRSFEALHYAYTLENIVKAMSKTQKARGEGVLGTDAKSMQAMAGDEYGTIADVRRDSGRLARVNEETLKARLKEVDGQIKEIIRGVRKTNQAYSDNSFEEEENIGAALMEAAQEKRTAEAVKRAMAKNGYTLSDALAGKVVDMYKAAASLPTEYFEAKPRRAVGFDEVRAAIVPESVSTAVRRGLIEAGVNVIEYEAGNDGDRLAKMNSEAVSGLKFSLRETDENVQSELSTLGEALALTKGHRITAAEADRLAGTILQKTNSTYDRETLAKEIARIYDYAERADEPSMEQIDDEQTALMARVMEKSTTLDTEHEEAARPVRDKLRTTAVSLTDGMQAEAAHLTGSLGAFRRMLFGRVRLNQTNGTRLDSLWPELSGMAPQWFPADAAEGDMPRLLAEAVDAMKPVYQTAQGFGEEETAQYMAGELNSAYLSLPGVKAAAKEQTKLGLTAAEYRRAHTAFAESSRTEFEAALRGIEGARKRKAMTEQQARQAALREKYRKWRERDTAERRERETRNRYTHGIETDARAMLRLLENPTDKRHVHADIADAVKRFVTALNFSKGTKEQTDLKRRISDLTGAMRRMDAGEYNEGGASYELPPGLVEGLDELARRAEGLGGVAEMSENDLKELSQWTAAVRHAISTANELHDQKRAATVAQAGEGTINELGGRKATAQRKGMLRLADNLLNAGMVDAGHFFERLGRAAQERYQALRDGFDKQIRLISEAGKFMEDAKGDMKIARLSGRRAKTQTFAVAGGELTLTRAQMMELYVLSRRGQAKEHLYGNGVLTETNGVDPVRVTESDVSAIAEALTPEERKLADKMQRFLAKNCAAWGNEASMEMYGVRLFGEKDYWPIRVDKNTVDTRNDNPTGRNEDGGFYAIKNMGITKAVQKGASNPLMVGDIFDTFTRHVDQMSRYAAYLVPVTDMMRWYNYRGGEYGTSVKRSVERVFGIKGKQYIERFVKDVNGATVRDYSSGIWEKTSRNAKVAAVGANLRVFVQQPTAYARAAAEMSPKFLAAGLAGKPMISEAKQYCPIALWKSWGFFDVNTGRSMRRMIVGDATAMEKAREAGTWLAGKADEVTWGYLFKALPPTRIEGQKNIRYNGKERGDEPWATAKQIKPNGEHRQGMTKHSGKEQSRWCQSRDGQAGR